MLMYLRYGEFHVALINNRSHKIAAAYAMLMFGSLALRDASSSDWRGTNRKEESRLSVMLSCDDHKDFYEHAPSFTSRRKSPAKASRKICGCTLQVHFYLYSFFSLFIEFHTTSYCARLCCTFEK